MHQNTVALQGCEITFRQFAVGNDLAPEMAVTKYGRRFPEHNRLVPVRIASVTTHGRAWERRAQK